MNSRHSFWMLEQYWVSSEKDDVYPIGSVLTRPLEIIVERQRYP